MEYARSNSPIGILTIAADEEGLHSIAFGDETRLYPGSFQPEPVHGATLETLRQLRAYFEGRLSSFDLPLKPAGTQFQLEVWDELLKIPYGSVISYGELARRIGKPTASRAVGAANGSNPIPIVIPCHRVIGSNGKLTGYAGGLSIKEALLQHEKVRLFSRSEPKAL